MIFSQEMYDEAMADPVYERIAQISSTGRTQEIMTYFEDALIYELIGPFLTKMALAKAGEIRPEGKTSARGQIASAPKTEQK